MALERYRQKRNFGVTSEPRGTLGKPRSRGLGFVVQKHAATRLHYDFRLEWNGVLLSWAVPKGPSLDPNDKRLAMHVEDHPLEYGGFEGVIPPRQYGAGTVMVWDQGTWTPAGDPGEAYEKGRLKFELHGDKLKGKWSLVRSNGGPYGGNGWLLFKEADEHARLGAQAQIVDDRPDSVLSGRTLEQIARQADRVWHSNRSVEANVAGGAVRERALQPGVQLAAIEGARSGPPPQRIAPQLATAAKSPPAGASWVHEIKHDGYRMLCRIGGGEARMLSRTAKDWTQSFAPLARSLARLPVDTAWLDGEVAVVDAKGRSSFQALQNALDGASDSPLAFFAFDLLYLDGVDLRGAALAERKRLLRELLSSAPPSIRYSEHFDAPGASFLASVEALGLEGMVSKRADLPYRGGRSPAWIKVKCKRRQEFVVGGFTDPEGTREGFGALMLGVHERDGRLAYCGKVGSGFDTRSLATLRRALDPIARRTSPFHDPPVGADARRAHWVDPVTVVEVSFTEWTNDGTLRQPVFVGMRPDKPARGVAREALARDGDGDEPTAPPSPATPRRGGDRNAIAGIALTNPDKVLYAEAKLAKRDLASYYAAVGDWMLPHLRGRPLTLVRCPDGWDGKSFYQKHADAGFHDAIARVQVRDGDGVSRVYPMAESVSAIVALLQMGALELHPWGSRSDALDRPDRIVFDLDPDESLPWDDVRQAAIVVRTLLENLGLAAYLKTTGGKGLHVVVPVAPSAGWDDVKGFAKAAAELLERTFPDRFTSKLLKVSRRRRVFVDYLRNAEGATAVAAYSLRTKAHAPVSTPIGWDELGRDVRFAHFNARSVARRLAKLRDDPWRGLEQRAVALTPPLMARVGYAAR